MQGYNKELLGKFIGTFNFLQERCKVAYQDYITAGKTFFHARILRQYNDDLQKLLREYGYLLPGELQADAIALLKHYDVWTLCWDDLHNSLRPAVQDEFAFANSVTFPREAAQRIGEFLQRTKKE